MKKILFYPESEQNSGGGDLTQVNKNINNITGGDLTQNSELSGDKTLDSLQDIMGEDFDPASLSDDGKKLFEKMGILEKIQKKQTDLLAKEREVQQIKEKQTDFYQKAYNDGKGKALRDIAKKIGVEKLTEPMIEKMMQESGAWREYQNQGKSEEQLQLEQLYENNKQLSEVKEKLGKKLTQHEQYIFRTGLQSALENIAAKHGANRPDRVAILLKELLQVDKDQFDEKLNHGEYTLPIMDIKTGEIVDLDKYMIEYKKNNQDLFESFSSKSGSGSSNQGGRFSNTKSADDIMKEEFAKQYR